MEDQGVVREEMVCESGEKMRKKVPIVYQRRKMKGVRRTEKERQPVLLDQPGLIGAQAKENHASVCGFSPFDHSVENHFRTMDKISVLCGEEADPLEEDEMKRQSEMVAFLNEWKYFKYKPRTVRFASETGVSQGKDVRSEISLSQFSSATVPRVEDSSNVANSTESRNDFVFYPGGCVWALDWCPRPDVKPDSLLSCEFIAVSAHPPDSAYHKLGAQLIGRGMVQIWCVVNHIVKEEKLSSVRKPYAKYRKKNVEKEENTLPKRPRGRPRKHPIVTPPANLDFEHPLEVLASAIVTPPANLDCEQPLEVLASAYRESSSHIASVSKEDNAQSNTRPKGPRGRPRKHPIVTTLTDLDFEQPLEVRAIEYPKSSSQIASVAKEDDAQPKRPSGQHRDQAIETTSSNLYCPIQSAEVLAIEYPGSSSNMNHEDENHVNKSSSKGQPISPKQKRKRKAKAWSLNYNEHLNLPSGINHSDKGPSTANLKENSGTSKAVSESTVGYDGSGSVFVGSSPIPKEILPPRVVLCLGHNGKVAWDVKWRPSSTCYSECKHVLGHLAVLLGDGSLEVWEIPSPRMLKAIYLTQKQDHLDPRFLKLKPVFRCSKLRCGDRQSIPLTVEWSTSPPHDLILAGCHDGMVALWKFSANSSSKDSRPILCFSADTVPIRALSWAPSEGDTESGNIIATAGHEGMKFWDLRDPFRPLWDITAQRFVYSLDWLPDPRCILTSYDDGVLRILSLAKSAYDFPVTGKPYGGTMHQGLHSYTCSPFTIWSIQASRHTGMVAYCGSNGTVLYFQLTSKAVDKDPHRNRTPHFLAGSLTDEDGILAVNIPQSDQWGKIPGSVRGLNSEPNKAERAKEPKPDDQPAALCYGEDISDGDMDEPISTLKKTKSKTSEAKKAKEGQGSASKDVDPESSSLKPDVNLETESKIEALPSKMVAVHKVRWNVNKVSRRWLCYGGASGVVRCHEIMPPP